MKEEINEILDSNSENTSEVKIYTDIREELRPFLNRKVKASGRVVKMKRSGGGIKNYGSTEPSFIQLLLKEVKLVSQNKDLKHHVNIFIPLEQLGLQKISIGNIVTFHAIVRQYKTYKPIEGIMIKLKNYSFNDIKVLNIEK